MPAVSPGRYQSRFFNFLHRQSLRFTGQCDRAARHLKVATLWGVQILLYPVYLLVQASLAAGRQLSNSAQTGWPELKNFTQSPPSETPTAPDTPIQRVLGELKTFEVQVADFQKLHIERLQVPGSQELQVKSSDDHQQPTTVFMPVGLYNQQPTPTPEYGVIQGVATLLETRTLVLVTIQNQVLDILTPQQQQKLSAKISWEVADLNRKWRLAQLSDTHKSQQRLTTLDRPQVFLPMRLFWKVMAWVQTSPVAIAVNLFQESTLLYNPQGNIESSNQQPTNLQPINLQPPTPLQGALSFVDRTVAELESHQLIPGTEVVITLSNSLRDSLVSPTQKIRQKIPFSPINSGQKTASPETSQPNNWQIKALISAAIDYFFGRRRSHLSGINSPEQSPSLANHQTNNHPLSGRELNSLPQITPSSLETTDNIEPDPWLTWGDLFSHPEIANPSQTLTHPPQKPELKNPNPQSPAQLPEAFATKITNRPRNALWRLIQPDLRLKSSLVKPSAANTQESKIEPPKSIFPTNKAKNPRPNRDLIPTKLNSQNSVPTGLSTIPRSQPKSRENLPEKTQNSTVAPAPNTHLDAAPDWIETQATPTGYVKHPLEKILQSVDHAMLWLEELILKIWQWLQRLGRRH